MEQVSGPEAAFRNLKGSYSEAYLLGSIFCGLREVA